jgi:small conductance mechanosensitive channel
MRYGPPMAGAVVMLAVAWWLSAKVAHLTVKALERARVELTLSRFMGSVVRWGILVMAVLACLSVFGVQTTSFAAVIGASALALGLAFQGSLSNMAAGIMLLLFRPFRVGDVVTVNGYTGRVEEIELFSTKIDTADNRRIILPNSTVFGTTVENITHNPLRRVDIAVGVDYAADIDRTRQVLMDAASGVPSRLDNPAPAAVVLKLGASSVDWQVQIWCRRQDYQAVFESGVRAVKLALEQAGIAIPFPQVQIHMAAKP